MESNFEILRLIQESAHPLGSNDYELILNAIGDAQIVMIGEASHGRSRRIIHENESLIVLFRFT